MMHLDLAVVAKVEICSGLSFNNLHDVGLLGNFTLSGQATLQDTLSVLN